MHDPALLSALIVLAILWLAIGLLIVGIAYEPKLHTRRAMLLTIVAWPFMLAVILLGLR